MQLSGAPAALVLWVLAGALLVIGLYMAVDRAARLPAGHTVKIMFVHVPSAWLAMMAYALIAVSSFGLLVFRHPLADVSAKAAAPHRRRLHLSGAGDGIAVGQARCGAPIGCGTRASPPC